MSYRQIQLESNEGVAVLSLNRPERLNAYTPDMGDEILHAVRAVVADSNLYALVITGRGDAFCAGADREYLSGKLSLSGKRLGEEEFINGFTTEFSALPILTIAAMNGSAAGIGITAMLAADIRICAQEAQLVLNFAELGIMPGMGSTYFLPRLIGEAAAKELLLCSRRIDGRAAAELGLVNHAVPAAEVLPTALRIAGSAAQCKPNLIGAIKRGIAVGAGANLAEALSTERMLGGEVRQ